MEAVAVVNEHWAHCQSRPGQKQVLTDSIQCSLRCSRFPLTQLKFLDLHSESSGSYKKNSIYTRKSHNKLSRRPMVKSKSHKECLSPVDKAAQGLSCYREKKNNMHFQPFVGTYRLGLPLHTSSRARVGEFPTFPSLSFPICTNKTSVKVFKVVQQIISSIWLRDSLCCVRFL